MSQDEAIKALKDGPLYDGGLLSSADQARLREALDDAPGVYVVLVPGGDLKAWRSLWGSLNLAADQNLLLLYNGTRWEAKGFGLSSAEISALLAKNEAELARDRVAGLAGAADGLYGAAFGAGVGTYVVGGGLGLVGMLGLIGGGLALRRRSQLIAERKAAITQARSLVEEDLAELILESDGEPDLTAVHEKAERIRDEVRRFSRSEEDPAVIQGRAQQVQHEVAALRTQVRNRLAQRRGEGP